MALTSSIAFVASLWLPRPATAAPARDEGLAAPAGEAEEMDRAGGLALLVANLAMLAGYGAFITTYAPLATERLGWTTVDVGLAFSCFGGGRILLGPPLAHLADRTSRRAVAILGALPVAVFGAALVMGLPMLAVFGIAAVAGAGLTAFNASWYALLADVSGTRTRGRVFGVVSAVSNTGIVIGAMAATVLWERVDIGAGMLAGSGAIVLAAVPLALIRPRESARTIGT